MYREQAYINKGKASGALLLSIKLNQVFYFMSDDKVLGVLYVVATPIGNLADITLRAVEILKKVDVIYAEDTRVSAKLLNHYGIKKELVSYHHHNEKKRQGEIEKHLSDGLSIALISDAGTPLISDPGYLLVNSLREKGFIIVPVPGASAMIAALSVSGLKTDQFQFVGFLPAKQKAKEAKLETIKQYAKTTIIYEAPHRLMNTLNIIKSQFGDDYLIVLAKEITKQHENFIKGTVDEIIDWLKKDDLHLKGEFVLMLEQKEDKQTNDAHEIDNQIKEMLSLLLEEVSLKKAVTITAKCLNQKKNKVYDYALEITKNKD